MSDEKEIKDYIDEQIKEIHTRSLNQAKKTEERIEKLEQKLESFKQETIDLDKKDNERIEELEKSDEAQISANEFFSTEITKQSEELSELKEQIHKLYSLTVFM